MAESGIRTSTLDELGDRSATPGTKAWAIAIRDDLLQHLHDRDFSGRLIEEELDSLKAHAAWKNLADKRGRPFTNYKAFCEYPEPLGLGRSPDAINREIATRKLKPGERTDLQPHNDNNEVRRQGDDPTYLASRIERDHPGIFERLKGGEFRSVRAAAIEAGIVIPRSRLQQVQCIWRNGTEDDKRAIWDWMVEAMGARKQITTSRTGISNERNRLR